MKEPTTAKWAPIERKSQEEAYDPFGHVATELRTLVPYARDVGNDIADAILKLLASVERRRVERANKEAA